MKIQPSNPSEEAYFRGHVSIGFKAGDKLLMFRKARDYEGGWKNVWMPGKDQFVGKIVTISDDEGIMGFRIKECKNGYRYPYFILGRKEEMISIPKKQIKIQGEIFNLSECIIGRL